MIKLVALYKRPTEAEEFDRHFTDVHLPLINQFPGLRKLEITAITGAPIGESTYHVMAEMYFDDKNAMDAALASREGKSVARDLMSFAAPLVTIFHGDVKS